MEIPQNIFYFNGLMEIYLCNFAYNKVHEQLLRALTFGYTSTSLMYALENHACVLLARVEHPERWSSHRSEIKATVQDENHLKSMGYMHKGKIGSA